MVQGPDGILGGKPDGMITPAERAEYARQVAAAGTSVDKTSGTGKVGWTTNTRGDAVVSYKDINSAKNYMNPKATEYPWLVDTFNKVKAAGGTSARTPLTWWAKVVDQAAASGVTPFQMAKSYTGDSVTGDGTTPATGTTGRKATKEELALQAELRALNAALAADPGAQLTGQSGQFQEKLIQYADEMGLFKGRREINSYVKNIMEGKIASNDALADMRKQASVLYPNFADRLANTDLTVRDLVNPYLEVMADTLELDKNTVKLTDPTIQNAINGSKLRSLNDFRMDMRNDSRFATTRTAKREATDFAQSLLKGFGFNI